MLRAEIDRVRAQKDIDLVCFTGDIENMQPGEVEAMMPELKRLPYMYSVLGNHDYAEYTDATPAEKKRMTQKVVELENRLGRVLLNSNIPIRRKLSNGQWSRDSIWLAGSEDYSKIPEQDHSNLKKTLSGIPTSAFVILLQHDPSAWEKDILLHSNVQLTLTGHTHGGQMQVLGLRPTMVALKEDLGLYDKNGRCLYVNAGLGGLVPFRLNMPGEITVITLHKRH
uniref:metallophosphoesterase n=1 Tax=Prevotella sp. TaxID=59823 RepID=UPI003FEFCB1F